MKLFELEDGETWWYAAESEDAALRMHLEPIVGPNLPEDLSTIEEKIEYHTGCTLSEISITELAPEETLKIRMENDETGKEELVEKTAAEWAADGAGFVACTVY